MKMNLGTSVDGALVSEDIPLSELTVDLLCNEADVS